MLSKEKKLQICDNITNSDVFKKAPKSSALLKYLVKSTLAGNYLKEDIIDLEFFGEKDNLNNSSPRIRVNIYNLRKKIDNYYETEGANATWRLCIDKGQYSVSFEKQDLRKTKFRNVRLKQILPYILLLLVSLFYIISNSKSKPPKLWGSYFKSDKKKSILVIADFFGMQGKTVTGRHGWVRDYSINSSEEYYELIEDKPELKETIQPAHYHFTTSMGAEATHYISKLFYNHNFDFDVRFTSNTSVVDLKKWNLIFVGPFLNKDKFISLFNDFNPYFKLEGEKLLLERHPKLKDTIFTTYFKGEDRDFSIVSRFKGPNKNECFLFFSNHDIGVKATVEHFTNKDSLDVFNKKYMSEKENFTALYEVNGKERTNLGLKNIMVVPF
ncbi:helix-turn-helix domain-containing protein [Flavivirga rizhaonensis]|uniref:Winged helix family transcriptional regulator n=1 Tax=Flavivirga rizhaonensis TaxID=2559571 RepID=A0A4S1DZG7_9FLAO|nr:helix-turn-helix domain-containing protein [Flavivirga rizhaonensis]TGV02972.1 winged helix family transcriptional regulator [Flavivirga rizhaonensis]